MTPERMAALFGRLPACDESTNPSNGWRAPDAVEAIAPDETEPTVVVRDLTVPICEECGRAISARDVAAFHRQGAPSDTVPAVCGDCADRAAADDVPDEDPTP